MSEDVRRFMPVIMPGSGAATMVSFDFGRFVLAEDYDALRARLSAAESRLREYECAPVVGHVRLIDTRLKIVLCGMVYHTDKDAELIIRPRGGKGE